MQATDEQAEQAIAILERAIAAARNGNQAGENAVVKAAAALRRQLAHDLRMNGFTPIQEEAAHGN